jgi:hypothetical protein
MLTSHLKEYSRKSALEKGKSQNTVFSRDLRFFLEKQFFSIIFFDEFFPNVPSDLKLARGSRHFDTYIEVFHDEEKNSFLKGTFSIFLHENTNPQ